MATKAVVFNTATDLLDVVDSLSPVLVFASVILPVAPLTSVFSGQLVSIVNNGGAIQVVLANATSTNVVPVYPASGYVLAAFTAGQQANVFLEGTFQTAIAGASYANVGQLVYLSENTPGGCELGPPLPTKVWAPLTVFNPGDIIQDSNGNWETCTGGGTSGGIEPPSTPPGGAGAWSIVFGGTTTDGSVTWTMSFAPLEQVVGQIVDFDGTNCTVIFHPFLNIGNVSSVGLAMPSDFSVSNSPITVAGTLNVMWNSQAANLVHAGPASGPAASPTWRNLVAADFGPNIVAGRFLAGPITGSPNGPATFRTISILDLFSADGVTTNRFLSEAGTWLNPTATPGSPSGSIQYNNAGVFTGIPGSVVTSYGGVTLAPPTVNPSSPAALTVIGDSNGNNYLTLATNGSLISAGIPDTGIFAAPQPGGCYLEFVSPSNASAVIAISSGQAEVGIQDGVGNTITLSSQVPNGSTIVMNDAGSGGIVLTTHSGVPSIVLSSSPSNDAAELLAATLKFGVNPTYDLFLTRTAAGVLALGTTTAGASDGTLDLRNISIGGTLKDNFASAGTSGYVLSSTGTGVQWVPAGTGTPGGTIGAIQVNDGSGGFAGDSSVAYLDLSSGGSLLNINLAAPGASNAQITANGYVYFSGIGNSSAISIGQGHPHGIDIYVGHTPSDGIFIVNNPGDDSGGITLLQEGLTYSHEILINSAGIHIGVTPLIPVTTPKIGFYGVIPVVQPTITGVREANPALTSLLSALNTQGLIVDSTTAGSAPPIFNDTYTTVTYVTVITDFYVRVDSTTPVSVTLTSSGATPGKTYRVKNINTGAVTVLPASGLIDGQPNYPLNSQYDSADFEWDGTNWNVF